MRVKLHRSPVQSKNNLNCLEKIREDECMSLSGDNVQLKIWQYQNRLTRAGSNRRTPLFKGQCAVQIEFVLR